MTVRIVKVIFCDEARRGRGTEDSMIRRVPALYTLNGDFICEYDLGDKAGDERPLVNHESLSRLA